jgi:dCMP deaminase
MARPTWDEYFKEIVQVTARRSPCERLHVGCLLVKDNRIISQGYNGFLPGLDHKSIVRDGHEPHCSCAASSVSEPPLSSAQVSVSDPAKRGHEQATVHAEQNCIADCARRGTSCDGCTAYITHYPCIICCRIMLAAGIKTIKYIHDYKNDPLVEHFIGEIGATIMKI